MGKRERIIEISLKLFMEKGFNRTTIDEITKLAGISKGSFYTYFKSKEELLESIIEELLKVVEEKFFKIINLKKGKPVDFIETFLNLNVSLSKKFSSSVLTIMRDVSFAPTKVREEMRNKLRKRIEEKVNQFISLIKEKVDREDAILLWGVIISLWASIIFGEKPPNLRKLSKKIWCGIGGERDETVC